MKGVAIFLGLFLALVAVLFWAKMKPANAAQPPVMALPISPQEAALEAPAAPPRAQ